MSGQPGGGAFGSADQQPGDIHLYLVDPSLNGPANAANATAGQKRASDGEDNGGKPTKKRKQAFDEHGNPIPKETRPRALRACDGCRKNKSRCELVDAADASLCRRCSGRGVKCTWDMPPQQRKPKIDPHQNDATTPGTAQMASMLAPYLTPTPGTAATAAFDPSLLNQINLGAPGLGTNFLMNPAAATATSTTAAKDSMPTTVAELKEAIAVEEAEVERLKLLLRYKQARQQADSYKAQLLGLQDIPTPPELAPGAAASQADKDVVLPAVQA